MKKVYILASLLLVSSLVITSCKGGGKGDKEAKTNEVIAEGVVNIIDEEYFRENIWDYSVQPGAFEYKGTVPVVIDLGNFIVAVSNIFFRSSTESLWASDKTL